MVEEWIYFMVTDRLSSDLFRWKEYLQLIVVMPSAFQKIKCQTKILQIFVVTCPVGRKGMSIHYSRSLKQDVMKPIPVTARSLRRGSLAVAGSNPAGAWLSLSCKCCVLSGRCVCDRPIPRPEESQRVCVCVCVFYWIRSGVTITLQTYNEEI
jgi:hypothetical protein